MAATASAARGVFVGQDDPGRRDGQTFGGFRFGNAKKAGLTTFPSPAGTGHVLIGRE
jgi:hypothetical protein